MPGNDDTWLGTEYNISGDLVKTGVSSPLIGFLRSLEMTSPQVSDALIPWNPHSSLTLIRNQEDSRPHGIWALMLHALSNPSPGRTLDRLYTSWGRVLETQANRAAYHLGLGPGIIAQNIRSHFGTGEQRVLQLECLQDSIPSNLEKHCSKLMRYTLPCGSSTCLTFIIAYILHHSTESAKTQCQSFRSIVELVTLFPGLRVHFLCAKCMNNATSIDTISAIWDRSPGPPDEEWVFWQTMAMICLTDTQISHTLEEGSIQQLTSHKEGGLSVIERLLVEYDCS